MPRATGQAEAGASPVPAAGGVQPREAVKDPLAVGQGDALSVVGDRQLGAVPRAAQADPYRAGGVPPGVVEQVAEHPDDLLGITLDGHCGVEPETDVVPVHPPGGLGPDQRREVHPLRSAGGGPQPGQQEQVGDDALHPVEVVQRVAEEVVQIGLVRVQLRLLQPRAQCGDGGAQLVRGVGGELTLPFPGAFGAIVGLAQPFQRPVDGPGEPGDLLASACLADPGARFPEVDRVQFETEGRHRAQ
nr:hypothetical protein [Microbispora siamensis]